MFVLLSRNFILILSVIAIIILANSHSKTYADPLGGFRDLTDTLGSVLRSPSKKKRKRIPLEILKDTAKSAIFSKVFDKKFVGIAIGITAGSFIAHELAKELDEEQKRHVTRTTVSTIVSGKDKQWEDKKTRTRGKVKVLKTENRTDGVTVTVYKDKVTEVPELDFIGETYEVTKNANVRGGPDTTYKKTRYFKAGTKVNVIGKVKDAPWYFVSENGVGIGFIYNELMQPSSSSIIATKPENKNSKNVYSTKIADSKVCRTVEQSVTLPDGTSKSEKITACKGANGWEMQPTTT